MSTHSFDRREMLAAVAGVAGVTAIAGAEPSCPNCKPATPGKPVSSTLLITIRRMNPNGTVGRVVGEFQADNYFLLDGTFCFKIALPAEAEASCRKAFESLAHQPLALDITKRFYDAKGQVTPCADGGCNISLYGYKHLDLGRDTTNPKMVTFMFMG